jgi:acetylornithine deacetylase
MTDGALLLDDAKKLLADLVAFEATARDDSNLALVEWTQARLAAAGAACELSFDSTGKKANLFATFGGDGDGGVALSAHSDVVPADACRWTTNPFVLREGGGKLFARGAADMKGFIACVLACRDAFAAGDLRRPLHFALSFDEEIGSKGAPILIRDFLRRRRPACALIGEPTMMRPVAGHKAGLEMTTTFTGVAAHAADPRAGVNAVCHAARFIADLEAFAATLTARDARFDPPGTTISVGTINGGAARNIVADYCQVVWECRLLPDADADAALAALLALGARANARMKKESSRAGAHTEAEAVYPGLPIDDASPALKLARALACGDEAETAAFGSDAGCFYRAGIPAALFGPGDIAQAHKPDEFIAISQLKACLDALLRLRAICADEAAAAAILGPIKKGGVI